MANGWSIKNWSFHLLRLFTKRQISFKTIEENVEGLLSPKFKKKKKLECFYISGKIKQKE